MPSKYKRKWRAEENGTGTGDEKGFTLALEIARFTGRIEADIERFERSRALPPGFVAGRISALLGTPQIREGLGHSDFLRYMRAGSGQTTETPEEHHPAAKVAARPHKSGARVGQYSAKGFSYNGTHWMQRPENKARMKKMMKERAARRVAKKKEAATKAAAA